MVILEFPFTYDDYINPHFLSLRLHFLILALENKRRELEWEFVRNLWELRGLWVSSKILHFHWDCVKCVEEWNTWKSKQNKHSYTIWTLNGKFTSNSQLLQSKPLLDWLFTEIVKNLFSIKYHQILIQIKSELFHFVLEEKWCSVQEEEDLVFKWCKNVVFAKFVKFFTLPHTSHNFDGN